MTNKMSVPVGGFTLMLANSTLNTSLDKDSPHPANYAHSTVLGRPFSPEQITLRFCCKDRDGL